MMTLKFDGKTYSGASDLYLDGFRAGQKARWNGEFDIADILNKAADIIDEYRGHIDPIEALQRAMNEPWESIKQRQQAYGRNVAATVVFRNLAEFNAMPKSERGA